MKSIFLFLITITLTINYSAAQSGNFSDLTFSTVTKGGGVNDYYGWGTNPNNVLDPRPNSVNGGAFIINAHQGLTFTAHSVYGGIRFYNQSYPGGPLDPNNGANLVMGITNNSVGIGTPSPLSKLHVYQNTTDQAGLILQGNTINVDGVQHYIALTLDGDNGNASGNFSQIRSYSNLYASWGSQLAFYTTQAGVANTQIERLRIDANGYVGIGTSTPHEALSVNGNIRSKEIKVETSNWPDYVFKSNYHLLSLAEIKTFIDKNHHLPEIPSEQEINKDGVRLGEMNKLLMKKVEELTLYLIEKDNQMNDQKKINQSLMERLDILEQKQNSKTTQPKSKQ
ncbi:MAG: hypothetical protein V4592_16100 [Bacteroidota bacterium]